MSSSMGSVPGGSSAPITTIPGVTGPMQTPTQTSGTSTTVDTMTQAQQTTSQGAPDPSQPSLEIPDINTMSDADLVAFIEGAKNKWRREKRADEIAQANLTAQIHTIPPPKPGAGGEAAAPSDAPNPAPTGPTQIVVGQNSITTTTDVQVYQTLSQRLGRPPTKQTMNGIMDFIQRTGSLTAFYSTLPALRKLGDPKYVQPNDPKVELAIGAARQEYVMALVNGGAVDKAAQDIVKDSNGISRESELSPDQHEEARTISAEIKLVLLKDVVAKLGAALHAPGIPSQVAGMAKIPRNVQQILTNEASKKEVAKKVAQEAPESGRSQEEVEQNVLAALESALKKGQYANEEDLRSAVKDSLKQQFTLGDALANTLAKMVIKVASNISPPPPTDLKQQQIKEDVVRDSIKNELIKVKVKEEDADRASIKIASELAAKQSDGEFDTLDGVDAHVVKSIKEEFGSDISDEQAKQIASSIDYGIPRSQNPIDQYAYAGALTEDQLKGAVDSRLNELGVADKDLRNDVYAALGLAPPVKGSSITQAISENYEVIHSKDNSYLIPEGNAAIDAAIKKSNDPAFTYIMQWAGPMSPIKLPPSFHRPLENANV